MTDAPELIFVGIDVSKDTLEVALDDRAKTCTLGNDEAGLKKLPQRGREPCQVSVKPHQRSGFAGTPPPMVPADVGFGAALFARRG